jgi:hypothetical protein
VKKPAAVATMLVLTASLAALAWVAKTSADAVRPSDVPSLRGALERGAEAAKGLRVMALVVAPGKAPVGSIHESARGSSGWAAYPPTADPADPLLPALENLAEGAAAEFAQGEKLSQATIRALDVFGVASVVVGDGSSVVVPDAGERDPALGAAPEVPGLRVRHALPVFLFLAEQSEIRPDDAVGFARTLRRGDADFLDYEDHATWGGDVTINAAVAGEYLLTWPAAGARVTIDGVPAEFRAARVPLIVVKVPKGRHRLSVRYGDEHLDRQWIAVAAAAVAVLSFVALWLGLRPHPERDPGA